MKKQETTGRHIRFPKDVDAFLERYALKEGFNSPAELVRQIVREKKQEVEAVKQRKAA